MNPLHGGYTFKENKNMTQTFRTKQSETDSSNVIQDLTLDETKSENVKGGARNPFVADSFSFGVEREMKESGEKGGTEEV